MLDECWCIGHMQDIGSKVVFVGQSLWLSRGGNFEVLGGLWQNAKKVEAQKLFSHTTFILHTHKELECLSYDAKISLFLVIYVQQNPPLSAGIFP